MRKRTNPTSKELDRRRKISQTLKKFLSSNPEAIQKRINTWSGRKHSEESRKKMSEARIGIRIQHSTETKEKIREKMKGREITWGHKISQSSKGKIISDDTRKKISESLKSHFNENPNPFKGKYHSEESKQLMREANLGKFRGECGPNWRGGISSLPYSKEWTKWLRKEIKQRDNHKCSNPRCKEEFDTLDIHHIDYDKDNNNPENLITICKTCHGKTQQQRKYWKKYYQTIQRRKTEGPIDETTQQPHSP